MADAKYVYDSGVGVDSIGAPTKYPGDEYFLITHQGIMEPLGVLVLRDSRHELLPGSRDKTAEIPGRHGEIDFGTELRTRLIEIHVATEDGITQQQKETVRRTLAKWLNPVSGTKKLVFQDDKEKVYIVKYSGKIDLTQYKDWMEFVIPFKCTNPFIVSFEEHEQTGNGTVNNTGTFETPVLIEMSGPATSPYVSVGGTSVFVYGGTLGESDMLTIDTDKMTVKLNGSNALSNYSGGFPKFPPGMTAVVAGDNVTIKWRDRWI